MPELELRLIEAARELVQRSWTQVADARSRDGAPVEPWSGEAASWSLLGALVAVVDHLHAELGEVEALRALAAACVLLAATVHTDSLAEWNDAPDRTREQVLDVLDRALAAKVRLPSTAPSASRN
jgi:hypothetical protein